MIDSTLSANLEHRIFIGTDIENINSFLYTSTSYFL